MSPKRDDVNDSEQWIKHFEFSCDADDLLSIEEIHRMTKDVAEDDLKDLEGSNFLLNVCMNGMVTLEIMTYLLEFYPQAINTCTNYDDEITSAYPLHLACYNKYCPNEVIQLLLKKSPGHHQLMYMCHMYEDWADRGYDEYGGTPLHYYLARRSNVELDIVKQLVANPRALLLAHEVGKFTPIHILLYNENIGKMFDVVKYLAESNPSSLQIKDGTDETPLHVACNNEHITTESIKLLLNVGVGVVYERNIYGETPLHCFCRCGMFNSGETLMDDDVAMDVLKLLLDAHPDWTSIETDEVETDGGLPLHKAARVRSQAFCKLLVDAYPESVRRVDGNGYLPLHHACEDGRLETVEYLVGLFPESLHIINDWGRLPIHCASISFGPKAVRKHAADVIKFLLIHDPECLSKPVARGDDYRQGYGGLPLHLICSSVDTENVTEVVFDLYPEAILVRNEREQLPVDVLRQRLDNSLNHTGAVYRERYNQRIQDLISYLYTQMGYATKAQNRNGMRTRDCTGSLPLHQAIRSRAPLGSIKLLAKGNPDAVNVPDGSRMYPLDIASEISTVGVVKYLAEIDSDDERLHKCDVNKNYPLHHACRGGNCEVIEYLLEHPMSSATVSERYVDGKLPIHLFCEFVKGRWCEGETPEYTETIWRLLTAYPETVLNW